MNEKVCRIEGFRSMEKIEDMDIEIPVNHITDDKLDELLRALVIKYDNLTDEEIYRSFLKKNVGARRSLLDVHRDNRSRDRYHVTCGQGVVHVVARVVASEISSSLNPHP